MRLTLGDFSAWVAVEGVEAECYASEYSEDNKMVTCWIASEAEKKFAVYWNDSTRAVISRGRVTVDGTEYLRGVILRQRQFTGITAGPTIPACINGYQTSASSALPFTFAAIRLTDDETQSLGFTEAKNIGEIKLVIQRATVTSEKTSVFTPNSQEQLGAARESNALLVHEKAKKASVHRVIYGQEMQSPAGASVDAAAFEILATFIFRYTSRDLLQAKEIIPRPPARIPSPATSHTKSLSASTSSATQNKTHNADIIEISDDETPPARTNKKRKSVVKTEEGAAKRIKSESSIVQGEVLDLTLD